jgi:putative transposase
MARPLRIEYPGAYYHVTSRGNEQKAIFKDDSDRQKFLDIVGRAVEEFSLRLHGYVLMSNHYHLLIETPKGGLNRALRYVNGVYTQSYNRRHRRVGHLFQGRYKAILVDKDSYLLELSRYIHLNPWRMKNSQDPFGYHWSSLGAYIGSGSRPSWLTVDEVLSHFGKWGSKKYWGFVAEGMKEGVRTPWEEVRGQAVLGSEEFVEEIAKTLTKRSDGSSGRASRVREVMGVTAERVVREVEKYFGMKREEFKGRQQRYTEPRYVMSYLLRRHCLLGLREIGEGVGLHYSAVGNAIAQVRDRPTPSQAKSLRELERIFKNQEN